MLEQNAYGMFRLLVMRYKNARMRYAVCFNEEIENARASYVQF